MIRAAVLGVGAFGMQHARIYADLDGVELVAVADRDADRAERLARRYKVASYSEHTALLEHARPDIVSVVVPTALHHDVALAALERGVHTLV